MIDYLRPYIEARRRNPGDDIISFFATAEVEGKRLDEETLMDFVRFLWPVAGENTQHGISLAVYHALADAGVKDRVLRSEKDRASLVEETLRIDPPVPMIIRHTEKSVTIAGVAIPADVPVLLAIGGANRDPKYFERPEEFSLDRGTVNHTTFGRGVHFCLGAHLARAEIRTTLDTVLVRLGGLRLSDPDSISFRGGLQRGPAELWIEFDELKAAPS
jgi:cytochrome P450